MIDLTTHVSILMYAIMFGYIVIFGIIICINSKINKLDIKMRRLKLDIESLDRVMKGGLPHSRDYED